MSKSWDSIKKIAETEAFFVVVGHRAADGPMHLRSWGIPRKSWDSVVAWLQGNFGAPYEESLVPVDAALEVRRSLEKDAIIVEGGDA